LITLYIFAILANGFFYSDKLENAGFDMEGHFGTIPKTMLTLFQVMTLDSWYSSIGRPIGKVYPGAQLFFAAYVLVASFGLMNLLTAIFIDSLNVMNKEGAYEEQQEKEEQKKLLLAAMEQVFTEYDRDKSGELDKKEMADALKKFRSQAYLEAFASVGLDLAMIEAMIKHADQDMNGKVNLQEFTDGINDMEHGTVKADIWAVQGKIAMLSTQLKQQEKLIADQSKMIRALHAKLDKALGQ